MKVMLKPQETKRQSEIRGQKRMLRDSEVKRIVSSAASRPHLPEKAE